MDTVYYHLNARRIKVSGGADLVRFVPAASGEKGEVLDFQRCRMRLERKELLRSAWEDEPEEEPREAAAPCRPERRSEHRLMALELASSAAVLAVSVSAVLAFISVL